MNLTDLRTELTTRATEADEHTPDLLPGVHQKIRRTKRRRVAAAAAGTAAILALGIGMVPGLVDTSAPEPADTTRPQDYSRDGLTLPGMKMEDRLEQAEIGRPGEQPLTFMWVPATNDAVLRPVCRSSANTPKMLRAAVNGVLVLESPCREDTETEQPLGPDHPIWLDAAVGRPAQVRLWVVDEETSRTGDPTAQLGLGIYRAGHAADPTSPPSRRAPTGPGDFTKDGIRYRAKIGGDTLAAAAVGDAGQSSLRLRVPSTGGRLLTRGFCTANKGDHHDPKYDLVIRLGGVERRSSCAADSLDAGAGGLTAFLDNLPTGTLEATATVVDRAGRPVELPGVRIALGIYHQGPQRVVTNATDGSTLATLPERVEMTGYTYKLQRFTTADATTTRKLSLPTPKDQPYLVSATSSSLGGGNSLIRAVVSGSRELGTLNTDDSVPDSGLGLATFGEAAGLGGSATLEVVDGRPTKGALVLAVYVPAG